MKKVSLIIIVLVLSWTIVSCDDDGGVSTPNPNAGFRVLTYAGTPTAFIPTAARVEGQFLQANGTTTGTVESFVRDHGGVGYLIIDGARVPARWRLTLGPNVVGGGSLCLTFATTERNVSLNSEEWLFCPPRFFSFTASPNSINALNPPATITFSGKGVESVYGEPTLAFYNEFGYVIASTQVQPNQLLWANGEIEGLQVSIPDITQVYDGTYTVAVHNIRADGSWEVIGAATVTIYGNPPPPPPPPPGGGGCEQPPPDQPQLPCDQPQQY